VDVHVGEVRSVVRVTDGDGSSSSMSVEQVVELALARMREELAHEGRVDEERMLRPAVSASESRAWERG
jgi:hypothetical protein